MNRSIALLVLAAVSGWAAAQNTPVGLWKTIDDKTGQARSLVRITEKDGVVSGRIDKRMDADARPDDVCDQCADDRKGQPIDGLEILRGLRKAEGADRWEGGTVLDPEEGKVYKARLLPQEGGRKLELRGYIGVPLLGRSQTWQRVE